DAGALNGQHYAIDVYSPASPATIVKAFLPIYVLLYHELYHCLDAIKNPTAFATDLNQWFGYKRNEPAAYKDTADFWTRDWDTRLNFTKRRANTASGAVTVSVYSVSKGPIADPRNDDNLNAASSGGGSFWKSLCMIASAASGADDSREVNALRAVRDTVLRRK